MPYNLTGLDNVTTTLGVFQYVQDLSDGWMGTFFLIGFFVIMLIYVGVQTGEFNKAWISASFVTTILAVLLATINLVGSLDILYFFVALCTGLIVMFYGGGART